MYRGWMRGGAAVWLLLIATALFGGCAGDAPAGGAGGAGRAAEEAAPATVEADSPGARAVVAALRERFRWHAREQAGTAAITPGPWLRGQRAEPSTPAEVMAPSLA